MTATTSSALLRTREQQRAADSYRHVTESRGHFRQLPRTKPGTTEPERDPVKLRELVRRDEQVYGGMAHKLPILIRTAGLVQALVFADTRKAAAQRLLDDLAQTVGLADRVALLTASQQDGLSSYMALTRDVLASLLWYKRFAQTVLEVDASASLDDAPGQGEELV